jgi:hypothetical protein
MRPFELFVERTLKDFESTLRKRDMTESARKTCLSCANEFAVFLLHGAKEPPPKSGAGA